MRLFDIKEFLRSLLYLTRSRYLLHEIADRNSAQSASMEVLAEESQALRQQVAALQTAQIASMQNLADENQALRLQIEALQAKMDVIKSRLVRQHSVMDAQRRSYVEMTRQLARLPAPMAEPASSPSAKDVPVANDPFLDIFYREFEDRYRGSREEILYLLREYVGHIDFLKDDRAAAPIIIDLGCGRGEWLEVLREQGLEAVGVDTNEAQAEAARSLGLQVEIDDAISYLSRQTDRSIDFISAFHLIEHLEFPVLTHLLKECLRVLKPEGRLLLETPNPQSLIVGAYKFWFDPTHVRPYPPELIDQLLESLGFRQIDVLPLHPDGRNFEYRELHGLAEPIADLLVGPLDYAILCQRP